VPEFQYHLNNQIAVIEEMKQRKELIQVTVGGNLLEAAPDVYPGWLDTELLCDVLDISFGDRVLDLCTGTGAIAIKAAQMGAAWVTAVDLNPHAVANAELNRRKLGIANIDVREGSLFDPVNSMEFDVIIINPPFVDYKPSDLTEICFWDDGNKTTKRFFREVKAYLKPGGRALFAWGDFADLMLIERLGKEYGIALTLVGSSVTPSGLETFLAYKLEPI
jgi:release factor glutamine methyltransferase